MNVADLYPTLPSDELKEAEYNFRRYLEIAFEIVEEAAQKHAIQNRVKEG